MGVVTGVFQYPNGSPVANASYQWKLSSDAIEFTGTSACVCPPIVNGSLDANGNMTSTFAFNDVLSTSAGLATYYQLTVKAQNGGQVWNEYYFLTGTAANLNLIPPAGVPVVVTTPVSNVLLQTNSVTNTDQVKLNVLNGPGVSAAADAVGGVTFSANLVAGTNITLATSTANAITINSTGGGGGPATFSTAGVGGFLGPGITFPLHWSNYASFGQITGTLTSGVSLVQFTLPAAYAIRNVSIPAIGAGTSTSSASFGIFSIDGLTKYVDSGVIAVSSVATAVYSVPVTPVTLAAGAYYFAQTGDPVEQALFFCIGAVPQAVVSNYIRIMNTHGARYAWSSVLATAAALPTTLGVITAAPFTTTQNQFPNVGIPLFEP